MTADAARDVKRTLASALPHLKGVSINGSYLKPIV